MAVIVVNSRFLQVCGFEHVSVPGPRKRKRSCTAVRYSCAVWSRWRLRRTVSRTGTWFDIVFVPESFLWSIGSRWCLLRKACDLVCGYATRLVSRKRGNRCATSSSHVIMSCLTCVIVAVAAARCHARVPSCEVVQRRHVLQQPSRRCEALKCGSVVLMFKGIDVMRSTPGAIGGKHVPRFSRWLLCLSCQQSRNEELVQINCCRRSYGCQYIGLLALPWSQCFHRCVAVSRRRDFDNLIARVLGVDSKHMGWRRQTRFL
jgi:hypothetical protein